MTGRNDEIERAARAALDHLQLVLDTVDWETTDEDMSITASLDATITRLRAALDAPRGEERPVDMCPMCKSAWPSVLYDPCDRMTAPNSWHFATPGATS